MERSEIEKVCVSSWFSTFVVVIEREASPGLPQINESARARAARSRSSRTVEQQRSSNAPSQKPDFPITQSETLSLLPLLVVPHLSTWLDLTFSPSYPSHRHIEARRLSNGHPIRLSLPLSIHLHLAHAHPRSTLLALSPRLRVRIVAGAALPPDRVENLSNLTEILRSNSSSSRGALHPQPAS